MGCLIMPILFCLSWMFHHWAMLQIGNNVPEEGRWVGSLVFTVVTWFLCGIFGSIGTKTESQSGTCMLVFLVSWHILLFFIALANM